MTWLVENKKIYTYCRKLRTKLSIHKYLTYVLYTYLEGIKKSTEVATVGLPSLITRVRHAQKYIFFFLSKYLFGHFIRERVYKIIIT